MKLAPEKASDAGATIGDCGPSSPKKPKLEEAASAKEKGSFSPMVSIPTIDNRSLLCHTHYDKWTFPGVFVCGGCIIHPS